MTNKLNITDLWAVFIPTESRSLAVSENKFLSDLGLDSAGRAINKSFVYIVEADVSLGIQWLVEETLKDFDYLIDPDGIQHSLVCGTPALINSHVCKVNDAYSWNRVNERVRTNPKQQPTRLGHVGIYVTDLERSRNFYEEKMGFILSDTIKGRCHFMRHRDGAHHSLLLVQGTTPGLHHISFDMPDIHSIISKGLYMDSLGWKTRIGPGRHNISSATFWYLESPFGLVELQADYDWVTDAWVPDVFAPTLENATEWAVDGGINSATRRQYGEMYTGIFVDEQA